MGLEVAVGFLVAWFARKAGRAWKRVDGITDEVLDAQLDRLCKPIVAKLGGDSALRQLEAEASQTGDAVPPHPGAGQVGVGGGRRAGPGVRCGPEGRACQRPYGRHLG